MAAELSLLDARARLRETFSGPVSEHPKQWSKLWDAGDFLPWDRKLPNPALEDTLADRKDLLGSCYRIAGDRKRALVPGCGRGYDVLLLASFGYDAYGLEVSEKAVELCREEQKANGHNYKVKDETAGAGKIKFIAGDFFGVDWVKETDGAMMVKFDLIYDYTVLPFLHYPIVKMLIISKFLCALPLKMRAAWSRRMSSLLSYSGLLIALEFPTTKPAEAGGPPFACPPQLYVELLSYPGQDVSYSDSGQVVESQSKELGDGSLKRVDHWQPARTHAIGRNEKGEVTDWVSVWTPIDFS